MNTQEIAAHVCQKMQYEALNAMQQQVLDLQHLPMRLTLLAPTGSGKTAAFAIYMLRVIEAVREPHWPLTVIAPSRELVLQIHGVLRQIMTGLKVTALYGGHQFQYEKDALTVMPEVIVATPGRLLDHLQRGTLQVKEPTAMVIDEYDKLMDMGFHEELSRILRRMGKVEYLALASATAPAEMPSFMNVGGGVTLDFAHDIEAPSSRMEVIEVHSPAADKLDTLTSLLPTLGNQKSIVFVNHREAAERIYEALKAQGMPCVLYHGGLDQQRRQTVLDMYANGSAPILVATDLAARGLDIAEVENIIHYHLPVDQEAWTHRNGRTARQTAHGNIYVIISDKDKKAPYILPDRNIAIPQYEGPLKTPRYASLYIEGGKRQGLSRGDILGALTKVLGVPGAAIGRIDLHDNYAVAAIERNAEGLPAPVKELLDNPKARPLTLKAKGVRLRLSLLQ